MGKSVVGAGGAARRAARINGGCRGAPPWPYARACNNGVRALLLAAPASALMYQA